MQADHKPEQDKPEMIDLSANGLEAAVKPGQRRPVPLAADVQARIGHRLTALYDGVLKEPVPDRFRQLLDELDAKTEPSGEKGDDI